MTPGQLPTIAVQRQLSSPVSLTRITKLHAETKPYLVAFILSVWTVQFHQISALFGKQVFQECLQVR